MRKNKFTTRGILTCRQRGTTLNILLGILLLACDTSAANAKAVDNWGVEGANGTLQVYGSLTESACRLEMDSQRQDIRLGNTDTAKLSQPGDRGTPVKFQIRLKDCVRGPSSARFTRTGNVTWSSMQPAVSVYFFGPSDADAPDYVQVKGAGGLALRLTDNHGRLLPLNQRSKPLLLSPGQDQLFYSVTPVRTSAALQAGAFEASINFRMIYD